MKNKFCKRYIKKTIATSMVIVSTFVLCACRVSVKEEETSSESESVEEVGDIEDINLNLWFSDMSMTDYLYSCAEDYEKANPNVKINLVRADESEYANNIIDQVINGEEIDLYLINNDELEKMKLAGVTKKNNMTDIYNHYNYSQKAIDACTYKGDLIAYPLSFVTSFVVYNREYVTENVPRTFQDIKDFADKYEVPAGSRISKIFTCDLQQIFYNYGFLGGALEIGGKCGDDKQQTFSITPELEKAVTLYKQLIEFFSIDISKDDFYTCLSDFENGNAVFTVADVAFYNRLVKDGKSEMVGVIPFPDMDKENTTSPLSVTSSIVVNPFSKNVNVVESFAKYISYTNADSLYEFSGNIACKKVDYDNEMLLNIFESYDKSTPKLKIMYNDEFYALLEVSMHLMAKNEDDIKSLAAVSSYLESHWK